MSEPFVLHALHGARWVLHPPWDPYGDSYCYRAVAELHDDGMTATTNAGIDGGSVDGELLTTLAGFFRALAADWRGWDGVRTWRSLEGELALDACHDGRGHVSLGVTLRAPGLDLDDEAWSARAVFQLEGGEEMTRLAADLTRFLRP